MTETVDIVTFLEARYAEEAADALAASHGDGQLEPTPGGEHWHWVYSPPEGRPSDGITDQPVDLTRDTEYVGDQLGGGSVVVSLRSVEEYPARCLPDTTLPSFVVWSVDEMPVAPARHIARHDPARVLADVAARRFLLGVHRRPDLTRGDPRHWVQVAPGGCVGCGRSGPCDDLDVENIGDCPVLRALAASYAGHPDHYSGWGLDGTS